MRVNFGKPVVDGKLRYLSPSAISSGDPSQDGGCERRYYYKYVLGKKEPSRKSQEIGEEGHKRIENYLRTGKKALLRTELAGLEFIPDPKIGTLLIEHPITAGLDTSLVKAAEIPLVGYMDCVVDAGGRHIRSDGEAGYDPKNSIEINDWKFTSDFRWAKDGPSLADTVQMLSYARWGFETFTDDIEWIRLSHVYFRTRGSPAAQKSTTLANRGAVEKRWSRVEERARVLLHVVQEIDVDNVDPNLKACDAYGGCPHRAYCNAGKEKNVFDILQKAGENVSLLGKLNLPEPNAKLSISSMIAAEAAQVHPGFAEAVKSIEASGKGFPMLTHEAAAEYAKLKKIPEHKPGSAYAGSGIIGGASLDTIDKVIEAAAELAAYSASATPPIVPPETPKSDPALAALPVTGTLPAGVLQPPVAQVTEEKSKRGRKKKEVTTEQSEQVGVPDFGLVLFVNCVPSIPFVSLDTYVDTLCATLATQADLPDIRCAQGDSPLGFGKWKGAIAAIAKKTPPPAGTYAIDARGREIAEVVADALRPACTLFVRGIG